MKLNSIESPCKGCTNRTVEPNCHNPDICDKWAAYWKEYQEYQKAREIRRRNEALAETYITDQYIKIMKARGWKHRK